MWMWRYDQNQLGSKAAAMPFELMQCLKEAWYWLVLGCFSCAMRSFVTAAKHLWENKSLNPGGGSARIKRGWKTLQMQQKPNCPLALPINTAAPERRVPDVCAQLDQSAKPLFCEKAVFDMLLHRLPIYLVNILRRLLMNQQRLWQSDVLMNTLLIIPGFHLRDPLIITPLPIRCWLSSLSLRRPEAKENLDKDKLGCGQRAYLHDCSHHL